MSPEKRCPRDSASEAVTFESFEDALGDSLSRKERDQLREIWAGLADLERGELDPGIASSFVELLSREMTSDGDRPAEPPVKAAVPRMVALAAAVVLGIVIGFGLAGGRPEQPVELARIAADLDQLERTLAAALEDGRSPSTRLTAIGASYSIDEPAPRVQEALLRAVESDPTVGVRLAAIDALDRLAPDQARVRLELVSRLPDQRSPLVQMAVLDRAELARRTLEPEALAERQRLENGLRGLLARDGLLPEVKTRTEQILTAL